MKMLLGLTAPTKGSFTIDGKQFLGDRIAILKEIGSFIEAPSFYANLTGRENLDIIRRILGLPKADVEDALELVGLTEFGDRLAKKYSLGMKQRLGLAGALLGRPPILILDEPTNGLDPSGIHEIRNLVKSLPSLYDCTVLISSHMLSEIELIADDIPVLLAVGILGAAYAFVNFIVRKDTLLNLPLAPMDVLLTQLYGMIMVLNLFGIVVAACMIYNIEFKGSAVKKMYMLPVSVPAMYLSKFLILTVMFLVAIMLQNLALAQIGMTDLPDGAFEMGTLVRFAGYSFITSMPLLSFMLLISSRFENMWVPLGIGVAGFLSGMALANSEVALLLVHPFVIILKPAVAMSAQPDLIVTLVALAETLLFLAVGLWLAKYRRYE